MIASARRRPWLVITILAAGVALAALALINLVGWPPPNGRGEATVVADWPRLPPDLLLGQVSGIDIDSQGNVFLFARGAKVWDAEPIEPSLISWPTVFVVDGTSGDLRDAWGANVFVMPHGLTLDHDDNVWLTDVGLHQVFKFDALGNRLLTLGEAGVAGADAAHFNRPTDVAVGGDGSIYVSDGYLNSRIVRFSADGRFLADWGVAGDGRGEFDVPHSVAVDAHGRVYVADRGNARVQIFDAAGRLLDVWQDRPRLGRPWAVRVGVDGFIYVVDGGDQNAWWPDRARLFKLTSGGEIVASFGRYGRAPGRFIWPHALAIGADGAVFVAEVGAGRRVQKFTPAVWEP